MKKKKNGGRRIAHPQREKPGGENRIFHRGRHLYPVCRLSHLSLCVGVHQFPQRGFGIRESGHLRLAAAMAVLQLSPRLSAAYPGGRHHLFRHDLQQRLVHGAVFGAERLYLQRHGLLCLSKYEFKARGIIYATAIFCMTIPIVGSMGAYYKLIGELGL